MGSDGKEKVQLRLDLGLIQMEMSGRPDGTRPKSCESLLTYHQGRAMAAEKKARLTSFPPTTAANCSRRASSITTVT